MRVSAFFWSRYVPTCLAPDIDKSARPGGFWTPVAIFGERLIDRLQAHAGLSFRVIEH